MEGIERGLVDFGFFIRRWPKNPKHSKISFTINPRACRWCCWTTFRRIWWRRRFPKTTPSTRRLSVEERDVRQDRLVVVLDELLPDVSGGAGTRIGCRSGNELHRSKAAICATVMDLLQVENLRISGAFVKYVKLQSRFTAKANQQTPSYSLNYRCSCTEVVFWPVSTLFVRDAIFGKWRMQIFYSLVFWRHSTYKTWSWCQIVYVWDRGIEK